MLSNYSNYLSVFIASLFFSLKVPAQIHKISSLNLVDFSKTKDFIYNFYAYNNFFHLIGDNKKYILNSEGQLIGIDTLQIIEYKKRKIGLYKSVNNNKTDIYVENDRKILVCNNGTIKNEISLGKEQSGRQIEEIEEDNNNNVYVIHQENIFDVLAPHLIYVTKIDTKDNFKQTRYILPFRNAWLDEEHRFKVADTIAIFNNSKFTKDEKEVTNCQQELIVTNTTTFDTLKTLNIDAQLKLKSRWEKTRIIWFNGKTCLFVTTCLDNNGNKDVVGMANIDKGTITKIIEYKLPLKPKKDALNKNINVKIGEAASYYRYFNEPNGISYSFEKNYLFVLYVTSGLVTIDTYSLKDYFKNF
ncbi:hypothetical protein ACFOW1_06290 [Parasediminibacterium paludis]|uniref:Uncharacterized protein n=1 Tax=Parasediminibacterium paludis TaxID=908966 RepID=A0ABV8PWG9_9BACT